MKDEKLIRIPLQFFGGGDGDEFDDDLGYEDDEYDSYGEDDGEEAGDGGDSGAASGEGDSEDDSATGDEADIIAELKAAGYVGDDLKSLASDMKRKREGDEKRAASKERAATNRAGKEHVKSGKPGRVASGEGMSGFTERDLAEINACLKNPTRGEKGRARSALERVVRANSK